MKWNVEASFRVLPHRK